MSGSSPPPPPKPLPPSPLPPPPAPPTAFRLARTITIVPSALAGMALDAERTFATTVIWWAALAAGAPGSRASAIASPAIVVRSTASVTLTVASGAVDVSAPESREALHAAAMFATCANTRACVVTRRLPAQGRRLPASSSSPAESVAYTVQRTSYDAATNATVDMAARLKGSLAVSALAAQQDAVQIASSALVALAAEVAVVGAAAPTGAAVAADATIATAEAAVSAALADASGLRAALSRDLGWNSFAQVVISSMQTSQPSLQPAGPPGPPTEYGTPAGNWTRPDLSGNLTDLTKGPAESLETGASGRMDTMNDFLSVVVGTLGRTGSIGAAIGLLLFVLLPCICGCVVFCCVRRCERRAAGNRKRSYFESFQSFIASERVPVRAAPGNDVKRPAPSASASASRPVRDKKWSAVSFEELGITSASSSAPPPPSSEFRAEFTASEFV
jgi:hypothetical protein